MLLVFSVVCIGLLSTLKKKQETRSLRYAPGTPRHREYGPSSPGESSARDPFSFYYFKGLLFDILIRKASASSFLFWIASRERRSTGKINIQFLLDFLSWSDEPP